MFINYKCLGMAILLGCCGGWLGFLVFGNFAASTKIVYVSQKELLNFETERIKQLSSEQIVSNEDGLAQIFLGRINEALTLVEQVAGSYLDNGTKLIFVTDEFVRGADTKSISKEVYQLVFNKLQASKKKSSEKLLKDTK